TPSWCAVASTSVLSASAMRPCRPITLPVSPGATVSSTSVVPRWTFSVTFTASGASTSAFAMVSTTCATRLATLLRHGGSGRRQVTRDERPHGVGRTGALADPVLHALAIDLDLRGLRARVVVPEDLDERAVARRALLGDDHAEEGPLLRAHSP